MTTLTDFLLARIAEDEARAEDLESRRSLADCEAKRRIVEDALDHTEQYRVERTPTREGMRWASMVAVGQLATAYDDHPDYDEAWRP